MIRYTLNCEKNHQFESWFQSAEAFDKLSRAGMVVCVQCGSAQVEKTLMSPSVRSGRKAANPASEVGAPLATAHPLSEPKTSLEAALAVMRRQIEQNSEYVGMNFAAEARAIHDGDKPNRAIYGEARADEARRLIEDGVPVSPLPFMPKRKTN